jgi:acid phosphatase type 7
MESDFEEHNPSFLYHLGDVIYKFGEASEYYSQFYEPYAHYPAPIFAIPGNKDGGVRPDSNEKSLAAFVRHSLCYPKCTKYICFKLLFQFFFGHVFY